MKITVRYFASLRDASQREFEDMAGAELSLIQVFEQLRAKYRWSWSNTQLRVAINHQFVEWTHDLSDGDEVVFIPPVSGG